MSDFWSPTPALGAATMTGTMDREQGPFSLSVCNLSRDLGDAVPEVGVQNHTDRGLNQTFPTLKVSFSGLLSPICGGSSTPGSDQLTTQSLSLPKCSRHMNKGEITQQQGRSLTHSILVPHPPVDTPVLEYCIRCGDKL